MSSPQRSRLPCALLLLLLLLLATAAGVAHASKQDSRYLDRADAEGSDPPYPQRYYREQHPQDFGEYVQAPYQQEQQPPGRMYDKRLLDLDPTAPKGYYYPPPSNKIAGGYYRQHSRGSDEQEMHRRHPEYEHKHKGYQHYPTHSYPAPPPPPPSAKGCGGRLPPTTCDVASARAVPQRSGRGPLVPNDQQAGSSICSSPGARYVWSAECEKPTAVGGTCKGSTICQPGDATLTATATCTAAGWVVSDGPGCFPAACSRLPERPIEGSWSNCSMPAYINQTYACRRQWTICVRLGRP